MVCSGSIDVIDTWYNDDINLHYTQDIHTCIYASTLKQHAHIDGTDVNYIEHTPATGINPNFPSIHIASPKGCNAWLHVVHTDSTDPSGKPNWVFVDAVEALFPFYSRNGDFYDAPHWRYTLHKKPLSYWKGHVYPVRLDAEKKNIHFCGGIEWGFELKKLSIQPTMITPRSLTQEERAVDLAIFEEAIKGYILYYL